LDQVVAFELNAHAGALRWIRGVDPGFPRCVHLGLLRHVGDVDADAEQAAFACAGFGEMSVQLFQRFAGLLFHRPGFHRRGCHGVDAAVVDGGAGAGYARPEVAYDLAHGVPLNATTENTAVSTSAMAASGVRAGIRRADWASRRE